MAIRKSKEVMIINRRSKKALQATGLDNGCVVEQAAPIGSDAQLWLVEKSGEAVKLTNKHNGKVLDVMAEGTCSGAWLQTWEDVGGGSQLWQIADVTATYKKLVNVRAQRVVDIVDMSDDNGAPAQLWDDVDGVGQQWKLVEPEKVVKSEKPAKSVTKTKTVRQKKTKAAKAEKSAKKTAAKSKKK